MGEVFQSDICNVCDGYQDTESEHVSEEPMRCRKVYEAANKIADSCKCFKGGIFTDWDEEVVKEALDTVPDGYEDTLDELLYCYMKGAPGSIFKNKMDNNMSSVGTLIKELTPVWDIFDGTDWKVSWARFVDGITHKELQDFKREQGYPED